jgi:SAM-dependent MidA family methyltransferase
MKSFIKFLPKSCLNFSKNPYFSFSEIKFITRTFNIEKFKHLQLHDSASSSNFLKDKIKTKILENGPISISEYMSMCLYDPNYGYYTSKEKIFGQKGDFITAPESSQLFGEMIGIFLYKVIESFKFPKEVDLVEIGGGTGHLMTDIVNTLYQFNLLKCLNVIMIEKSPKLQKVQQETIFQALAKKGIYMQYIYDEVIVKFIKEI